MVAFGTLRIDAAGIAGMFRVDLIRYKGQGKFGFSFGFTLLCPSQHFRCYCC